MKYLKIQKNTKKSIQWRLKSTESLLLHFVFCTIKIQQNFKRLLVDNHPNTEVPKGSLSDFESQIITNQLTDDRMKRSTSIDDPNQLIN